MQPATPPDEKARLSALRRYEVLDTPPEPMFDRIVRIATRLFGTPIGLVSLVDENRQWFKSCFGVGISETSRDVSFCAQAILSDEVTVVTDALQDERFADNPFVTGEPGIRFYVGAPLRSPGGLNLGTLCIVDTVPRPEPEQDKLDTLVDLAAVVVEELELRREVRDKLDVHEDMSKLAAIVESSEDAITGQALDGTITSWNPGAEKMYGYTAEEAIGRPISIIIPGEYRHEASDYLEATKRGDKTHHYDTVRVSKDGRKIPISLTISPVRNDQGEITGVSTIERDVTERLQAEEAYRRAQQETIRELSTPVLQLQEELLLVPLIGAIDSHRVGELTQRLLAAIRDVRAKVVVIDITGVPNVDTAVANHLVKTVEAARLMGARAVVTGLSAEVAQALVTLGVDLAGLTTGGDLRSGIEMAGGLLAKDGGRRS